MSTFIPLAYLYKFQKDFCSHCLLSVCTIPGAFFCLTCVQYKIGAVNMKGNAGLSKDKSDKC